MMGWMTKRLAGPALAILAALSLGVSARAAQPTEEAVVSRLQVLGLATGTSHSCKWPDLNRTSLSGQITNIYGDTPDKKDNFANAYMSSVTLGLSISQDPKYPAMCTDVLHQKLLDAAKRAQQAFADD